VVVFGYKDGHFGFMGLHMDIPLHIELFGQGSIELFLKIIQDHFRFKLALQPHKEYSRLFVHMLVQINYVSFLLMYECGYRPYNAGLVGTMDKNSELHGLN
jgi:hypothetical protein